MEAKMHEFLHQQNLIRYRKLLTETTNEAQRHQLLKLLAEEEAYEQKPARQKKAASVGGLFHFKPSAQCRLLAQSGHFNSSNECRLSEAKRTSRGLIAMSALTQSRHH
jgi:hypothetical protein